MSLGRLVDNRWTTLIWGSLCPGYTWQTALVEGSLCPGDTWRTALVGGFLCPGDTWPTLGGHMADSLGWGHLMSWGHLADIWRTTLVGGFLCPGDTWPIFGGQPWFGAPDVLGTHGGEIPCWGLLMSQRHFPDTWWDMRTLGGQLLHF